MLDRLALEEMFFERFLEPGEDEQNRKTAREIAERYEPLVESLAQDFEDGLVIENRQEAALNVQMYLMAKKFSR